MADRGLGSETGALGNGGLCGVALCGAVVAELTATTAPHSPPLPKTPVQPIPQLSHHIPPLVSPLPIEAVVVHPRFHPRPPFAHMQHFAIHRQSASIRAPRPISIALHPHSPSMLSIPVLHPRYARLTHHLLLLLLLVLVLVPLFQPQPPFWAEIRIQFLSVRG